MMRELLLHVIVSSLILALALAAATWIRPLTARTRHAILIAGMAALVLPSPMIARLLERNVPTVLPKLSGGAILAPATVVVQSTMPKQNIVIAIWAVVAAILFLRWWIVTQRLVHTAMRAAAPPPPRTVKALESARRRLGIHHSIDLIASTSCEAPAVVRVLRPMIILPPDGCDALNDEELESLLCHECAHVARRDNLLGVLEAMACSVFWFNPLVWLAHRRIAAAREAACDERVADAALPAETYVGALAKVCRALLAPRVPAVSCMASAHLKERIQHLMSYDTVRKSAFSHRAVLAGALVSILLAVGAAGVVIANPVTTTTDRFELSYSLSRAADDVVTASMRVVDSTTKEVLAEPKISVKPGTPGSVNVSKGSVRVEVTVETKPDASGTIGLVAWDNDVEVQRSKHIFLAPDKQQPQPAYMGEPISMDLANADIKDVLRTFGQLTGLEITTAPEVEGSINVHVRDTPWDKALDDIVRENGYAWRLDGNKMYVYKP